MDQFPAIPQKLLEALIEQFPERSADINDPHHQLMFKGGQVSVIRFLKSQFEEQNSNILDRTIT